MAIEILDDSLFFLRFFLIANDILFMNDLYLYTALVSLKTQNMQ